MTAGSIIVPAIIPLRPPIPGKSKLSIDTNVKIELSTDQKDVEIFYTINGKKPDPFPKVGSERYTMQYFAPFTLPAGKQTVKAMAVSKDGMRESNIGTKIFEVGFVPSREVAPVDDDLGFQEELDHQNTTLNVKRATKNLLLSEKTAWTDMGTMKQTIQKMADMNVSGSNYRKPTTGTRFLNNRKSVHDKNEYNRSHDDTYGGRSSRRHDRDIPDAQTQANRLTREAELLKSYSETQSDPFSRYYISRGNTGQQEARPIPPKPGKMGTCVYCKSVVPFNTQSCVVCEGPIPLQYHQPNPEIRSSIKERDVHEDRNGFMSGVESQWLPVSHPVGAPLRPTSTVSTQTVGLFYPSEKGLSNKKEEIEKKVALEQSMRDRQPLMTPVSPGKGYWRKQVDHICHHLKAHAQNDAEFRALIGEPKMGKLLSGAVQEDGHELSITLTFAIRGNKDPLTGRKLGITGDYLSMHTENDSLTSYRSDSEDEEIAKITGKKKTTVRKPKPRRKETPKVAPIDQKILKELGPSGEGDPTEIQRLIDEGANAECTNKDGLPCIYVAIKNRRVECLPVLIDQGVEVNQKGPSSIRGNTPLHEAVTLGTSGLKVVDTLLGLGADINRKNDRGETPYDLATKGGYENIVKKLCSHLGQSQLDKLMKHKTKA
ncbi:Hypothetical predicted protein [Mytilus galloprovincialis]|uniref:GH29D-like beta-sandwich domain-containing protein n=1 Tax=Mytilus galloprovincialis TaxID=29158 RepID=A0A8B6BV77_MYTGA|nr:Hypothetical predicted protein [Mytilus galloprovincialis]